MVAIEPYFFNLLVVLNASPSVGQNVSAYYALDLGIINLVLGYFTHQLTLEKKKLIPKELIQKYKITRNATYVVAALFLVSAFPIFWHIMIFGTQLRIFLWVLSFPVVWAIRILQSSTKNAARAIDKSNSQK